MVGATTASNLHFNNLTLLSGIKGILLPGIWMTLCPLSMIRTVSRLLLPARMTHRGPRREKGSVNIQINSFGFRAHRHRQIWGENGTLLSSHFSDCEQKGWTKKLLFLFGWKGRFWFFFFWLLLKADIKGAWHTTCSELYLNSAPFPHECSYASTIFPKGEKALKCKLCSLLRPSESWVHRDLTLLLGWRSCGQAPQLSFKKSITE